MEQKAEIRELARRRRKRRARRQLIAVLIAVLAVAAVVFLIVSALGGRSSGTSPESGETASTGAASTAEQTQTERPSSSGGPMDTESPPETEAPTEPPSTSGSEAPTEPEPTEDESWKLMLVNADHPLSDGFTVQLKELRNGHHVDERIYPELQQMFDDARAVGIHPFINESYRTSARQQEIMDKYIANYMAAGMSREQAEAEARKLVAIPGTSEHELGLALDIIAEFDADSTATWKWLKDNSWRYGFILRYPEGKEEITGISYEPWHFRYVGVPTAQEITESGLCLEEYIASRN